MNNIHNFAGAQNGRRVTRRGGEHPYRQGDLLVAERDIRFATEILRAERAQFVQRLAGTVRFSLPEESDGREVVERLRRLNPAPEVALNQVLTLALHEQGSPHAPPEPADALDNLPDGERLAGDGVRVGVVDTGLDLRAWFKERAVRARQDDVDDPDEDGDGALDYAAGHGTACAGIILQHAPGAEVVVRRQRGHLDDASIAAAILELVGAQRVDILNLSFGGYTDKETDLLATRHAIEAARRINRDLVIVAAAGNNAKSARFYPAAYPGVIAVGGLDVDGNRVPFSNYGSDWVDCCSRAVDLVSTYLDWNGAVERGMLEGHHHDESGHVKLLDYRRFDGFARFTGTSFSAPRVAGGIAATMSPEGNPRCCSAQDAVYRLIRNPNLPRSEDMGTIVNPRNYVQKSAD